MVTTLARFGQNLAVTTLELTVLANICCTLATYLCWWSKPNSIETSHFYSLNVPIEDIVRNAGNETNGSYRDTPLDFVSRDEWSASRLWNYYVNILRHLGLLKVFNLHFDRPAQRINTFNWPKPGSRRWAVFLYLFFLTYTAIFLAPWNFHFPTPAESWVWRTAALVQSGITVAVGVFEILWYDLPVRCSSDSRPGRGEKISNAPSKSASSMERLRDFWEMPCNNEVTGNYPCVDVPLRSILITTPFMAVYTVCRWFILVEDLMCLRSLPASVFEEVDWTQYLPWL